MLMGQPLLGAELRRASLVVKAEEQAAFPEVEHYQAVLRENGCSFHPALYYSLFRLKNGLKYPGLATKIDLPVGAKLVTVRRKCLLTARKAFSQLQQFYEAEFRYFRQDYWQDKVLLAFLLHVHYTRKEGLQLLMLGLMDRGVDVLCCWREEELKLLRDPDLARAALKQAREMESDCAQFMQVTSRWPSLFPEGVRREDYWWVQVHLISRCFGSFEYTTLIPFMEFFNHSVSDICWEADCKDQERWPEEEERLSVASSQDSLLEDDEENEGEFDYSALRYYAITWVSAKNRAQIHPKTEERVAKEVERFEAWLFFNLDWGDNLSFVYAAQALQKLRILHSDFLRGKKSEAVFKTDLESHYSQSESFKDLLQKYYSRTRGPSFKYDPTNFAQQQVPSNVEITRSEPKPFPKFPEEWKEDSLQTVSMKTTLRDRYQAGHQVFYCYGRLSNRLLLQRYGFALEHNKYDKTFLHYYVNSFLEEFPDFAELMQTHRISLCKRLRLKRNRFCEDLVVLHRALLWREHKHRLNTFFYPEDLHLQVECIEKAIAMVTASLQQFKSEAELRAQLAEPSSYHEYFAKVYILGRVQILGLQLALLGGAKEAVAMGAKGCPLKQAVRTLPPWQQKLLEGYFNSLRRL